MIAISSFIPKGMCDDTWENQVAAHSSWVECFDQIVYFNDYESDLVSHNTFFVGGSEHPMIKDLAGYCATFKGWSCIINADIITTQMIRLAEAELMRNHAKCAVSRRFVFKKGKPKETGKIVDFGLDIFLTTDDVWIQISEQIPSEFRLGHCLWDTWMAGFFHKIGDYYDITAMNCCYHPHHEFRNRPFEIPDHLKRDPIVRNADFPVNQIVFDPKHCKHVSKC